MVNANATTTKKKAHFSTKKYGILFTWLRVIMAWGHGGQPSKTSEQIQFKIQFYQHKILNLLIWNTFAHKNIKFLILPNQTRIIRL